MTRTRTAAALCAAALLATTLQATAATAGPAAAAPSAARDRACTATHKPSGQARKVVDIVRKAQRDLDLQAAIVRVTVDGRPLVTAAVGESMTGVPATPAMHVRTGSVGIAFMGTVLSQLVQERKVSLDDKVSRWLPELPHADKITLRMLGSSTSGLHDYVTDPAFQKKLYADPWRHWTPKEVVGYSLSHPLWYKPGTNWSYSHANFVLLGKALEKITRTPLDRLHQQRVYRPLGLRNTRGNTTAVIPEPVLHAYDSERGFYEESTYFNPSWTTAPGAIITQDICDLARSGQGIGAGELLSPAAFRTQLNPGTVGLGKPTAKCPATVCLPMTDKFHFGLGVVVKNGWVLQNPSFFGYAAVMAYEPHKRLSIAVTTTVGPKSPGTNTSVPVAERIAQLLDAKHPLAD
ncbi:serine hydrolase domain-containing protein [Streptomyces antibioticus]|uniref:Beta-lactamase family protein n=1 Tax=Streptomyces antibioticus TaxID=1890 RepID=A0AAE6YDR1_STRAT|nr:serine hydrolase domain-containing protein [Streptomyces antibioticus]OOQ47476.1 serine hydrolase [Streptomyces antibioticus]QIT47801.1 beta-lactamase family protein [Streptomyces antibioticus]